MSKLMFTQERPQDQQGLLNFSSSSVET